MNAVSAMFMRSLEFQIKLLSALCRYTGVHPLRYKKGNGHFHHDGHLNFLFLFLWEVCAMYIIALVINAIQSFPSMSDQEKIMCGYWLYAALLVTVSSVFLNCKGKEVEGLLNAIRIYDETCSVSPYSITPGKGTLFNRSIVVS